MSNYASEGSKWLKEYSARVNQKSNKSNGNKWLMPLIITIILGGLIGIMIANGALDAPQKMNAIKILGAIGGVMLLLTIILIATSKKKVASNRTAVNLDELLKSSEEVQAFDQQMAQKPIFSVDNPLGSSIFATKDYLGYKFSDMGDESYQFIHLRDIASIHYQGIKGKGLSRIYFFDLRDNGGKVLLNGTLDNRGKLEDLLDELKTTLSSAEVVEDGE
ncbi:MAG: hypothetical protein K6G47_00390 [Clostridia bacterium]|nr:hypothetical protein [Clostridia bacterium]